VGAALTVERNVPHHLTKYDFGILYSPVEGSQIGFKHESMDKKQIRVGKVWGHFLYTPRAGQSVASEFGVDI